tara:strand:- start:409 stop:1200 length:792 start_codon:yes stop_codon:yes gene_type:complete
MPRHHCGTYTTDTYCSCFDQRGGYLEHYKQFNEKTQTYHCCDKINVSLKELHDNYDPSNKGAPISDTPYKFFQTLHENGLTGCDFDDYFVVNGTSSTNNFIENYPELYLDYLTVTTVYNNFVAEKPQPKSDTPNYITCDTGYYPYILEYRSPSQVYNNNAYICSQQNNDVFKVLNTGLGRINYSIKRFWNFETDKPCIEPACRLKSGSYGNIANQGNQNPVYNNFIKAYMNIAAVSIGVSAFLLIVWLYLAWRNYYNPTIQNV